MQLDLENQIRERAYQLWLAAGCEAGESEQHWLVAERELLAQKTSALPATDAAMPAAVQSPRRAAKTPAKSRRRAA